MRRRPPERTFDTPSRTVVVEPLEAVAEQMPLTVAAVSDDRGGDDDEDDGSRSPA